jgi:hypothetical protein
MPDPAQISRSIAQLAASDGALREEGMRALHTAGVALSADVIEKWCTDAEFRGLIRPVRAASAAQTSFSSAIVVGIAVTPENFERIHSAHASPPLSAVPPSQDAREFELHLGDDAHVDVLTSRDPAGAGAVARYLQKFGEGIQQIELYVRDVDCATGILRSRFAVTPIYPETQLGAESTCVNFFLVSTSAGKKLLIELVGPRH